MDDDSEPKVTRHKAHVREDIPKQEPKVIQQPQPVETPPVAKSAGISPPSPLTMAVSIPNTKLRKTPSKKAAVVKTMKRGEEVTIVKQKNDWFMVELVGGEVGWLHKSSFEE